MAAEIVSALRIIFLFSHLLLTFGLIWTRSPMVAVTLKYSQRYNQSLADNYDRTFLGLIIFNMVLLLFELILLMRNAYKLYAISYVAHMVLDILATFFISWMIFDGWVWTTFVFIVVFCSLVPCIYDVGEIVISWIKISKSR